jgi:hypothetical protein
MRVSSKFFDNLPQPVENRLKIRVFDVDSKNL